MSNEKSRAVKPTALVSVDNIRVMNESTKIAIRMTAGVERIVPPYFVGLALAAGALPGMMYKDTYGQYKDIDGKLQGEPATEEEPEVNPAVVVMEPPVVEAEDMLTTEELSDEAIKAAIATVQGKAATHPDLRSRLLAADGKPKVPALEQVLNRDLTAARRDAVWDSMAEQGE